MAVFVRAASNGICVGLNELRLSVGTLTRLGVRCYEQCLLLGDAFPCFASVEQQIPDDEVCMPTWMMAQLGLCECSEIELLLEGEVGIRPTSRARVSLRVDRSLASGVPSAQGVRLQLIPADPSQVCSPTPLHTFVKPAYQSFHRTDLLAARLPL